MRSPALLGAAVLVAVIGLWGVRCVRLAATDEPAVHRDTSAVRVPLPRAPVSTVAVEPARTPVRDAPSNMLRVTVTDAAGSELADVAVLAALRVERCIDAERRMVARTGADGVATVPVEDRDPDWDALTIHEPGYCPVRIDQPKAGGTYDVRLRAAATLRADCVLADGTPLSGVQIALSRTSLPPFGTDEMDGGSVVPTSSAADAVHVGESDARGQIEVGGLPDGGYMVRLRHETHVLTGGLGHLQTVEVPCAVQRYEFMEPYVAALQVRGDEIVTYSASAGTARVEMSGTSRSVLGERMAEIRRRFPGSLALVHLPYAVDRLEPIEFQVLARRSGWRNARVGWQRWSEFSGPDMLELASDQDDQAAQSGDVGEVLLDILGADGTSVRWEPVALYQATGSPSWPMLAGYEVRLGVPTAVPTGHYIVSSWDPVIRQALPDIRLTVGDGLTRDTFRSRARLALCEISVSLADSRSFTSAFVQIELLGHTIVPALTISGEANHARKWLPAGELTVRAHVWGYPEAIAIVRVDVPSDPAYVQPIVIPIPTGQRD